MTSLATRILSTVSLALLGACHVDGPVAVTVTSPPARPVSILVEVYDPLTNQVWENVAVRVVEADQEWSQCTCPSPYQDWMLTGSDGRVLFNEYDLAAAEVGFVLSPDGGAVLGPGVFEDEAVVLIEVDALGFQPVIVEVVLSWDNPDVFVEVPFGL